MQAHSRDFFCRVVDRPRPGGAGFLQGRVRQWIDKRGGGCNDAVASLPFRQIPRGADPGALWQKGARS